MAMVGPITKRDRMEMQQVWDGEQEVRFEEGWGGLLPWKVLRSTGSGRVVQHSDKNIERLLCLK
jgi:hypothetical protein